MDWPGRITILEDLMRRLSRALADMDARLRRAEQNLQQVSRGSQSGGGAAPGRLCKAYGDIDPRAGTTAGAGQADLCDIDPDTGAITIGDRIDVWNPSATEMEPGVGIAGGLYCWAEKDASGVWVIAPLECGE